MQSGGGSHGRKPTDPPSSSSSPSSSAVSNQLGFESQQQQQLNLRNQQQQQLRRKHEGEENLLPNKGGGGLRGVIAGGNFPSSLSVPANQPLRMFGNLPQQHGALVDDENQNKGQNPENQNQNQNQKQNPNPNPNPKPNPNPNPNPNPIHQAYLQFAMQAAQQQKTHGNLIMQHPGKFGMVGPLGRDQDARGNNLQAASQQQQAAMFQKSSEQEQGGRAKMYQRADLKPPQNMNMIRPMQSVQAQPNMENVANNQLMAQFYAWAMEHNIDLSLPANANLIAQLLPMWQSAKMAAMQKANEWGSTSHQVSLPSSKSQVMPSSVGSETSIHRNSVSDQVNGPKNPPFGMISSNGATTNPVRVNNIQMQQQLAIQNRESQIERVNRSSIAMGDGGGSVMHPSQASESSSQNTDHSGTMNKSAVGADTLQTQLGRQLQQSNRPLPQPAIPPAAIVVSQMPSQGGPSQAPQGLGFTKQQLFVLKAQILAFRRIKRGEGALPPEVLEAIVPPPPELEPQQVFLSQAMGNHESSEGKVLEENVKHVNANNIPPQLSQLSSAGKGHGLMKAESTAGEERTAVVNHLQGSAISTKEHLPAPSVRKAEQSISISVKAEQETERDGQLIPAKGDYNADKGKAIPVSSAPIDAGLITKSVPNNNVAVPNNSAPALKDAPMRKYHGPLFDFLCFTRKAEPFGSAANSSSCLTLAYDVKDFLFEEGKEVLTKKRTENLKKISGLLAINLERKRIRPDLVTRLQIEEKKLRLLHFQARLREEVDQEQQEIMAMPDRPYRKFVRQCERQRIELSRQVQQLQKCAREKQLKSIFLWRKKLLESHWAIRDARTTRNRGVAKIHERMLKEFAKRKDDDRNKRMEALKNNDVDRYREILLEQQTNVPGDAAQRYAVLSSFLSQTEEYLHKLGGKITAAKNHQEVEEAANAAATSAISQGLSEEEVKAAAICAGEEVMIRYQFSEMNAPRDNASDNKYYNLAHAVSERVTRQSSMLRAGTLRDYQIVGLQWMLSLYNNKLNGILADEMGLGKTVQVMALIAYLMEFKGNYGPHLIIVPNAVLVNWKSELHNWLPNLACIFYVGSKEQRSKLFSHEVCALKFNVLVTTYEFVMFDRSKLSKIDWKYIIIDEAQRMKDRESVLARDLDRYRCQRRLLLTGTPLQNNLKELWSLLNLLLPEVFDNKKAFNDWFSKPFQKDAPSHSEEEDDWLETEKKVIIIHRLHQILEPFMLRRRVEDVEGSLPPKVPIVLKCRMSAIQGAIYDWVKSTGTIRVDPEDELRRSQKNPMYQTKSYKNLNNKCMELRKACNHPLLNYPYFNDYSMDFLVRSCGKLWILDRILIKLQRAGHRVLLFSTMTKLLDILEEYLQWRRLVYRRIDGTTSLEDRESAIVNFNCPDSDCFIFLLSIRAAGRGLNLQTADTVVIYDPDPNPQNEEQAVARAHRIGQTREVKVIYMEAVVDKFSSYQKEDELRSGGTGELEDDLARTDRYMGSIESLIRNNIQQYKIDMADEVINAGRFDQRTTHEERRMTLETLLHDEERYQETLHDVPSLEEVNRMISRSEEEIELFNQMDEEFDWTGDMLKHNQVPKWLRAGSRELDVVVARLSKKPSKNILASSMDLEPKEILPNKSERRGRAKKSTIYREVDEDDDEDSDASSVERNASSLQEEEGELGEFDDEDLNGDVDMQRSNNKDQEEEDVLIYDGGGYEFSHVMEENKIARRFEEGGASSGSSSGTRRLQQSSTPSISSQKFGSLSALDAKPKPRSKRMSDELEEGEIAVSGDSYVDRQQSGSWSRDHDDGEEEQVLQPKIRRKRSMRIHPKSLQCGSQLPMQVDNDYDMQSRTNLELDAFSEPGSERDDLPNSSMSQKHTLPPRSPHINLQKSSRLSYLSAEEAMNHSKESQNGKVINTRGTSLAGAKMSDSMQRKCKNVISKLQRRISRDGQQIVPVLYDLWKKNESASPAASTLNPLDLLTIDQCIDNLVHNGVTDFIADFQLMLKDVVKYCKYSYEVKYEARKLHDLFFDIMKIAFPDTDFRDARNVLTFPSHGGATSTAPPKLTSGASQSKMRLTGEAEANPAGPNMPNPHGPTPPEEGRMTWAHASKLQKESRPFTCPEPLLTHPGELVICKKKRQDRRVGPVSPPSQGRILPGPLSPSSAGRAEPASSPSTSRGARVPAQQTVNPARWGPTPGGGGSSSGALSGIGEEAPLGQAC